MRPTSIALEDIVEWRQTPPPISSTQGSFRLRRGSRFTWRKECLAVMERWEDVVNRVNGQDIVGRSRIMDDLFIDKHAIVYSLLIYVCSQHIS